MEHNRHHDGLGAAAIVTEVLQLNSSSGGLDAVVADHSSISEWNRRLFSGMFFIALGLWWMTNVLKLHFLSRQKPVVAYESQPHFPVPSLTAFPAESLFRLGAMVLGIMHEAATSLGTRPTSLADDHHFARLVSGQQMTVYAFFAISTLLEIIAFYAESPAVPSGAGPTAAVLAFAVQAFVFRWDVHGRSLLFVTVHSFLHYVALATAISIFVEVHYRDWVAPSLARSFLALTQGTWTIHVALMLFPPDRTSAWDAGHHDSIMLAASVFIWHCFVNVTLLLAISRVVLRRTLKDNVDALMHCQPPLTCALDTVVITSDRFQLVKHRQVNFPQGATGI